MQSGQIDHKGARGRVRRTPLNYGELLPRRIAQLRAETARKTITQTSPTPITAHITALPSERSTHLSMANIRQPTTDHRQRYVGSHWAECRLCRNAAARLRSDPMLASW